MNWISAAVYVLVALSMAIGLRLAPRRGFNDDSLSLGSMTCLKGVMALFVVLHHLSQKRLLHQTGTIPVFENVGFLFVGVFFLTSGYGLYKSFVTKEGYLGSFLRRRVLPVVAAYYVMVAVYAAYHLASGSVFQPSEWALKLAGIVLINSQSWFIPVIILMYLAFFLIYRSERLRRAGIPLLLGIALAQGVLFCVAGHFPWWLDEPGWWMGRGAFDSRPWWMRPCVLPFGGEWWVNSTVGFVLGVALAKHEDAFFGLFSRRFWPKFAAAAAVLALSVAAGVFCQMKVGYWTEFRGTPGILDKLLCYSVQCAQVVCTDVFVVLLMRKVRVQNRLYTFLGRRSLEMYLMQEAALFGWLFLIERDGAPVVRDGNWNAAAYMAAVTATVVCAAVACHFVNGLISRRLKGRS